MRFGLVPLVDDLVHQVPGCWEPICERVDDALEGRRVANRLNRASVVPLKIVVELNPAWLLPADNKVSNFEEEFVNVGVLGIKLGSSFYSTRALIGLQDDKEFLNKLLSFLHQVLLAQMNVELVVFEFKVNNVSLLVLVKVLAEHIRALGVSLAPFVGFGVEKLQAEYSFSELAHNINPKHGVNLFWLETEQAVDFRQLAKKVAACVRSTFFKAGTDGCKFTVPGLALFVATFKFFSIYWILVGGAGAVGISIDQLANTVTKKFVAGDMNLIAVKGVLVEQIALL